MTEKKPASYRLPVVLAVGYEDPAQPGKVHLEAEVRAVTGGDELYIGMSREYNQHPNDLVYKTLLLSRTVTRLGPRSMVTIDDITRLHAQDVRVLENAVYTLTYGADALPGGPDSPG